MTWASLRHEASTLLPQLARQLADATWQPGPLREVEIVTYTGKRMPTVTHDPRRAGGQRAVHRGQVAVADPAGPDPDAYLTRTRINGADVIAQFDLVVPGLAQYGCLHRFSSLSSTPVSRWRVAEKILEHVLDFIKDELKGLPSDRVCSSRPTLRQHEKHVLVLQPDFVMLVGGVRSASLRPTS
jgi:hypothetical protein